MEIEQLKELAYKEADNLRVHASEDELNKLVGAVIDGSDKNKCVYGHMTGTCESDRAVELMNKCATKVIVDEVYEGLSHMEEGSIREFPIKVFGDEVWSGRDYDYMTPIEVYIDEVDLKEDIYELVNYILK